MFEICVLAYLSCSTAVVHSTHNPEIDGSNPAPLLKPGMRKVTKNGKVSLAKSNILLIVPA
jgi:hypothetical protein